jgi:integrase/recombinase XerD
MDRNCHLGDLWIEAVAAERGFAVATLSAYGDHLDYYLRFLRGRRLPVERVDAAVIAAYLEHLNAAGFADKTIEGRRAVIRGLHRFLMSEGVATADPISELAPMRRVQKLPTVLSVAEVSQLLSTAHALADQPLNRPPVQASYARRAALLETLYASGMLISEAVRLPARAAQTNTKHLLIVGKGDKERIVPLHDKALIGISRWRRLADEYGMSSGNWLFHSVRDGDKHLTTRSAAREIKEVALAAGLPRVDQITPHVCSGTPSPPTYSPAGRTYGLSKSSLAIAISKPPRSTCTWESCARKAESSHLKRTPSRLAVHWSGRSRQSRNERALSQRSSTLSANSSSARVRPRLIAAIGIPRRAAAWAKRKPE